MHTKKKKGCMLSKIITVWRKPITQKRVELWGFQPISSLWSHLGLKQRGFVGSEDEQKSHFPSWRHLPVCIYMAVVLKSGRKDVIDHLQWNGSCVISLQYLYSNIRRVIKIWMTICPTSAWCNYKRCHYSKLFLPFTINWLVTAVLRWIIASLCYRKLLLFLSCKFKWIKAILATEMCYLHCSFLEVLQSLTMSLHYHSAAKMKHKPSWAFCRSSGWINV